MKTRSIVLVIFISLFLTACGIKERAIDLKDRIFNSDSDQAGNQNNSDTTELTGMLLVLEPENCPLYDGCGPRFSLLGRNLDSQIAINGDIDPEHDNLILSASGIPSPLSEELSDTSGYKSISAVVAVSDYRLRSTIPYHPFLVERATEFTNENFGCDLLWDKSYFWTIEDDVPHLIVKMTNTLSAAPQPWVQLTYDGNSGELIKSSKQPEDNNPCD